MTPEEIDRQKRYLHISKLLHTASKSYENASLGIIQGNAEVEIYKQVKDANELIELIYDECLPPRRSNPLPSIPKKRDYTILKIIGIAGIVLGCLYAFVVLGPTGDLSKTWKTEDLQKNVAYPK